MSVSPPRAVIREVPPSRRRSARAPQPSLWGQERRSFGYAFEGLGYAWRTQRHLRIHVALGLLATGAAMLLGISTAEWAALLAVMTMVIALELVNTVVEAAVDIASPGFHPKAKVAKDVAAAAVLVTAIGATLVGSAIFIPRAVTLLTR